MELTPIRASLADLRARVDACRPGVEILLAVKYQDPRDVQEAVDLGWTLLGHNYTQHAQAFVDCLDGRHQPIHHHMIGHVQSNKLSTTMKLCECIQSVDSPELISKIARRVVDVPAENPDVPGGFDYDTWESRPYPIMLQVSSSGATTQSGINPEDLPSLLAVARDTPEVEVVGIMTIGANSAETADRARAFTLAQQCHTEAEQFYGRQLALSMGMSNDFEQAIEYGATMVRIGSAAFGPRPA